MLRAYMDETGHSRDEMQKFNGMAGLLAPADRWDEFESRWNATLANKEFRIPYFHMREFEFVDGLGNRKGFYTGWSEEKRRRLFSKLVRHIKNAHALPVGSIVAMEDWRRLSDLQRQLLHGDPYFLAYQNVIAYSTGTAEVLQMPADVQVELIFSDHAEFKNRALRLYDEIYSVGLYIHRSAHPPEFHDMKDRGALQAADLIAYEMYKEYDRVRYRPQHKQRWGFLEISNQMAALGTPLLFRFYKPLDLIEYAQSSEREHRRVEYWRRKRARDSGN